MEVKRQWLWPLLWCMVFGLLVCSHKKTDEDIILAQCGEYAISVAEFARTYQPSLLKTPVDFQDSPALRTDHLQTLVTRYFLSQKAKEAQLHQLPYFRQAFAAESLAVIIHGLYEKEIASQLPEIREEQLREAFQRMHKKLHVRHLVSKTKEGIDSLYCQLQQGATFEELAEMCFSEGTLKNSGGDLGLVSWGDMDIDFENVAYSLRIGEYSKPVETKFGWHIIKVDNIIENPIIREEAYHQRRESIRSRLRHIYLKNRADKSIKVMMEKQDVHMNIRLIEQLETQRRRLAHGGLTPFADIGEIPTHGLQELLSANAHNIIATYKGGNWTVADVLRYLPSISPVSIQQGIYATVAMSLRNHLLLERARKKRIDRIPAVRNEIEEKRRHLLSSLYVAMYADTCRFTEQDIQEQYEKLKDKMFLRDKEMEVLEILCDSEKEAYRLRTQCKSESDFRRLAQQYTRRRGMREKQGYLGMLRIDSMSGLGKVCYGCPVGKVCGPFRLPEGYSLVMVLSMRPIYADLESVKGELMNFMKERKREMVFQRFKKHYRQQPLSICDEVMARL